MWWQRRNKSSRKRQSLQIGDKIVQGKTRVGGKGNTIEMSKKLKFVHIYKWYMYKRESILVKETHKRLWYFKKQTEDLLILAKRPDQVIVNKKKKKKKRKSVKQWTLPFYRTKEWK